MLSIGKMSQLFGVSVRTLRYYEESGLIAPTEKTAAGYRLYGQSSIERMQQIMYFRRLGFSLKHTAEILSAPDYDKDKALIEHKKLLELERERLCALIELTENALEGKNMKNEKHINTGEEIKVYEKEARERWGGTPQYAESEKKRSGMTDEQHSIEQREAEEIFAAFAAMRDGSAESPEAAALCARWRGHITKYHYECTKEILSCLADMYTGDERFKAYLDAHGEGTAEFMSRAIKSYCI